MLKFIGNNGCFSLGNNTSAYYIKDDKIILFDCGETVFKEILRRKIINDKIKYIDIIITHFHSDHIGSLGSLLFYCRYKEIKIRVVFKKIDMIINFLEMVGIDKNMYQVVSPNEIEDYYLREYEQLHGDIVNENIVSMPAYGYHFICDNDNFFFSGDTMDLREDILKKFQNNEINILYHDVATDGYKSHIQLEKLESLIDKKDRNRVFLMHLKDNIDIKNIKVRGFNIAEVI